MHAGYGIDFLQFTEQPRTIWGTNSAPEALRLMAYWTSYIGVGFEGADKPLLHASRGRMLFNPLVVGASLLLPAIAVAGFVWTRRLRYAPFFLFVFLAGMAIEVAGFPDNTPSRDAMEWTYRNVELLRFMRTTQKAAPLVALGGAGLLGVAAQMAVARLAGLRPGPLRRAALVGVPAAALVMIALAALPLVRGTAVEKQLTWDRIPAAWTDAGDDLDRDLAPNSRAFVLPGQIFAYYKWGGTIDAILPRVTDRPVAVRYETPYSDPTATDLLWTIDRLVAQRRLFPGQLKPLLRLVGTGAVITGSDDDVPRSGAVEASAAAESLAGQGLDRPARSYGPTRPAAAAQRRGRRRHRAAPGAALRPGPRPRRGRASRRRLPPRSSTAGPRASRRWPASAHCPSAARSSTPATCPPRSCAASPSEGADVVVSDSNRRRRFVPEFGRQNLGPTLRETEPLDANFALIDPFPLRGPDSQTVAALEGATYLRAPYEGGLREYPEHAPIAAFDGNRATTWAADRYFLPSARWIEVGFDRPRDVPFIELEPTRDAFGVEREVDVNGVRAKLGPGVTRIRLGLKDQAKLRVTITKVDQPGGNLRGGGGFREIRIPGVRIRQPLRPPVIAGRALANRDLSRVGLSYVFERTTADEPFRRNRQAGSPQLELVSNREDAERQIDRVVFAPGGRSYEVRGQGAARGRRARLAARPPAGPGRPGALRLLGEVRESRALPGVERLRRAVATLPGWASGRGPARPIRGCRGARLSR